MQPTRFDALTKAMARPRLSRRSGLRRLAAGALTATLGALGARPAPAAAQAATPAAGGEQLTLLVVQSVPSGTFLPKEGAAAIYQLTLRDLTHTVYFADRPSRRAGVFPTQRVLDNLDFEPDNPPNAALVAETADGQATVIIELLSGQFDEGAGTVTYDVRILADSEGEGLKHLAARQTGMELAASFGPASLFIDAIKCCELCFTCDCNSC